ncbi:heavy metal-associated isoprenylated plant protein 24-like [Silene latifolia]|uniref:heavy metal-associated isoprenylated plant protein 24-like n=1 Tax=Silene latifolia TaxID=37657 RepID=UPI003D782660
MGVEGTLEYLSDLIKSAKKKKRKQFNTVNLKVTRIDCEGCALKIKKTLSGLKGVKSVDVDMKTQKVTVTGFVEPKKVLAAAQATKKKVEIWPYVPYTMVAHPYIAGAYDKKAPPNLVRKVDDPINPIEERYTTMFSDENPDACSIM